MRAKRTMGMGMWHGLVHIEMSMRLQPGLELLLIGALYAEKESSGRGTNAGIVSFFHYATGASLLAIEIS